MAYTPTVWKNGEAPAINAENLNNIEQGIAGADSMASQALEKISAGLTRTLLFDGSLREDANSDYITTIPTGTKFISIKSSLSGQEAYASTAVIPYNDNELIGIAGITDMIIGTTGTSGNVHLIGVEIHKTFAKRHGFLNMTINSQNANITGSFFTGGVKTEIYAYS